jgi:hypothetical protein
MSFDPARGCWPMREEDGGWQTNNECPALDVFGGRRCGGGDKVKAIQCSFLSHTEATNVPVTFFPVASSYSS